MFVYQNANRDICVTFKSNKPVEDPEYVIAIDPEEGTLTVNGQLMVASEEAADEAVDEETPVEDLEVSDETDTEETTVEEDSEKDETPVEE